MSLSVCDHQSLEAVLAVDMEALEQFGVFEGIEADGTGQLVFQLLESLLGYSLRFSHFSEIPEGYLSYKIILAQNEVAGHSFVRSKNNNSEVLLTFALAPKYGYK